MANEAISEVEAVQQRSAATAGLPLSPLPALRHNRFSWLPDRFTISLVAAFAIVNLWLVFHHAMWRDEWNVWQTGRLHSWRDVYAEQSHSGHPIGWFLCAWVFDKLGTYPWGLKVFHMFLSTAYIFLFTRYAPFTRLQKVLFACGYFPLFEYGTILRDYAGEVLGLMMACVVFTLPRRRPLLFGLVLAYLFQTTAFGMVIGVALGAAYLFDLWLHRDEAGRPVSLKSLGAGMAIALASLTLAYLHIRELPGNHAPLDEGQRQTFGMWLGDNFRNFWCGLCPIQFGGTWNTNFLNYWPGLETTLGALLLVAIAALLTRQATALVTFLLACLGVFAFHLIFLGFSVRHQGHYFLIFIIASWIYLRSPPQELPRFPGRAILAAWGNQLPSFLTAVLIIHVIVGVTTIAEERVVPFSGSQAAAEIIQRKAPNLPIIGDIDYAVAPVSGYLNRPIYIPYLKAFRTISNEHEGRRLHPTPAAELAAAVNELSQKFKSDVVLIVNYPLNVTGDLIELIGTANPAMVGDETYQIYRIHYAPNASSVK